MTEPIGALSRKGNEMNNEKGKEVNGMVYRYGFGFRGVSPPWPYVGRGRGGLPRCRYFGDGTPPYTTPAARGEFGSWRPASYQTRTTPDQELTVLREEAGAIRSQLDEIEARIKDLETDKQPDEK